MKNILKKTTLILTLFNVVITGVKAQVKIEAASDIVNKACIKASKEKKKVFLLFRASWNPWDGVLESAMAQSAWNEILTKYYVISKITVEEKDEKVKLENPGAAELFAKYYANTDTLPPIKKRVPVLIALNTDRNKIAQYIGFPEGEEDFNDFANYFKQTSAINQNEIAVLRKVFLGIYLKVTPTPASDILNRAFAQAGTENKKVFLIFHASWCHWCHVLDTAMNDPACRSLLNDRYVICHLTVSESYKYLLNENPGAGKLLATYQAGIGKWQRGIPLSIIFDKDGNKLGMFNGFPVPFYNGYEDFVNLLKNTSSVNEPDLKIISEAFERTAKKNGLKPRK